MEVLSEEQEAPDLGEAEWDYGDQAPPVFLQTLRKTVLRKRWWTWRTCLMPRRSNHQEYYLSLRWLLRTCSPVRTTPEDI